MYDAQIFQEAMMGGMGSGARRSANVGDIENAIALNICTLRRLQVVQTGECVINTIRWSIGGLDTFHACLRVDLSDIERGGVMTITGSMPDGTIKQRIAIDAVPSAFGGWRCYFFCPITARRCEVLYYTGSRFASRDAQRLTYATQNMTDLSRARRRAAKLRGRLCGSGSKPHPRGRNRIKLAEQAREAEREAKAIYHDRLSAIVERSGAPWIPKAR